MNDEEKTKQELIEELEKLRIQDSMLEKSESLSGKSEGELNESEEFSLALLKTIPVAIAVTDLKGNITFASEQAARLYGYESAEELIGKSGFDLIAPEEHEATRKNMEKILQEGSIRPVEYTLLKKDGTRFIGDLDAALIKDAEGNPKLLIGTGRDVTHRKDAENELAAVQKRLHFLISTSPAVIYSSRASGDFGATFISENVKEQMGYDPEQFVNDSRFWTDQIHPDDKERVFNGLQQIFERGSQVLEYRFLHRDGKYRWMHDELKLVRDHSGNPIEIVGYWVDITKRKQAEEELRKHKDHLEEMVEERTAEVGASEEKHRTLFETMAQGVVYQDVEGRIISANPAAQRILGLSLDQMLGRTSLDPRWRAVHEDGSEFPGETHPSMEALRTGQEVKNAVMGVFNPQIDEYKWININAVPQFKPGQDKPYRVFTTFDDITERKRAEEALKESNVRLLKAQKVSQMGFLDWDLKTDEIFLSEEAARIHGLDPGLKLTTPELVAKAVYPDDLEMVQENLQNAVAGIKDYNIDHRIHLPNGEVRWVHATAVLSYGDDGKPASLLGTVLDITERKRAEEALLDSEERYRSLLETSPDAIIVTDLETNIILANRQAIELYGADSEDEVIGLKGTELVVPHDRERAAEELAQTLVEDTPRTIEYSFLRKDGSSYPVDLSVSTVRDSSNNPKFLIAVARDITERKLAEALVKESEARNRAILNAMPDLMFVQSLDGTYLDYHATNPEDLYMSPDKFLSKKMQDVFPEKFSSTVLKHIEQTVNTGEIQVFEYQIPIADRLRYFEARIVPHGEDKVLSIIREITERKWAAEAVRESEEKYRILVETSPDAIIVTDLEIKIIMANRQALQLIRAETEDEVIGTSGIDLLVPQEHEKVFEGISAVKTGIQRENIEYTLRRKNGEAIPVEVNASLIRDSRGEPESFMAVVRDISERKGAEEALRESEARYRRHFENVSDVIYSMDSEFRLIDISPSVERVLGYKPEELMGRPFQELNVLAPEYLEQAVSETLRVFEGESIESAVYQFITRDGTKKWGEVSAAPLVRDGKVIAATAVARDITERKRAEESIRSLHRLYESTVSTIPSSILILDDKLNIVMANQRYLEGRNLKQEEVEGKNIEEVFPIMLLIEQDLIGKIREVARSGGRDELLGVKHVSRDHPDKFLNIHICGISDPGEAGRVLLVIADVTEQTSLREQLYLSQKLEAVGQLAGGVAHDFNNLLTVILSMTGMMLKNEELDPSMREDLNEIEDSAKRAAALTRQLLAFSRKQLLQPEVLDLNTVIKEMHNMLHRIIGEDVDLKTVFNDKIGFVKADPGQIEQVIMNLAVNARDAMPRGGKLTIELANAELDDEYAASRPGVIPGPYVMLAISDSGHGMDQETTKHVFEPFFTTKGKGKGTGLGLATVYGIIKQSGGNIWVYSESGKGTTFKMYLPIVGFKNEKVKDQAKIIEKISTGTETILVVEDEESLRGLAKRILQDMGYTVLTAAAGEEAIETIKDYNEPIHLILTDVVMPGMSGRDLVEQMSATRPEMKVLYMSGYTDNTIVHHGVLEADTHFLQKPFTAQSLAKKIRSVLDQ